MTTTTTETLSVNGTVLNTLAKNIESISGRLQIPAHVTDNVQVPGRHGRLHTLRKYFDEGQIVLPMWVIGTDDNGLVPTSKRQQFFTNIDILTRLFYPGNGMLEVLHTLPDGSIRRVWGEVTEAINFAVQGNGNPLGKFSVAMRCPYVFWEDQNSTMVNLTPAWNGPVAQFDGMTAPVEDSVITVTGPCTSIKIESIYNGTSLDVPNWVQYAGALTGSQTLIIDNGKWTLVGTGGLTVDYSLLTYAGGARWFTMVPSPFGQAPGVKITTTGSSGATNIKVVAKRKYLVG